MAEADEITLATTRTDEIRALVEALTLSKSCEAPVIADDQRSEYKTAVQCRASAVQGSSSNSCAAVSEYITARRRRLEQLRSHCCSEEENEIEKSQEHWTQVGLPSSELDLLHLANHQHFHERILKKWPFFEDYGDRLVVGKKIAEGGQAEIFEATIDGVPYMLKVFKNDYSLEDLEDQWTLTHFKGFRSELLKLIKGHYIYTRYCSFLKGGTLLKDGSFAFVMERYWGDLRALINLRMEKKNSQGPPFQFPLTIMIQIAKGMVNLHNLDIVHRDLKASNVLLVRLGAGNEDIDVHRALRAEHFGCYVADFDCCEGAMGTRFWRAPEVLIALRHHDSNESNSRTWTEKIDVYSYAITCYEILTGCIPSDHLGRNEYDSVVVRGERPPLPDYVDYRIQELLIRCWHSQPSERPNFYEIVDELQELMHTVAAFIRPVHLEPWFRLLGENPTLDEILNISIPTILPWKIPKLDWTEA